MQQKENIEKFVNERSIDQQCHASVNQKMFSRFLEKKGQNKNKKKIVICNRCGQLNTIVENLTIDITVLASARSVPTLN